MPVTDSPLDVLQRTFGFGAFRDGQEQVVAKLLAGRSVLAIFPTGAGKSLCYQLPALMLDGVTLVISPLIALMKDQIDFLVCKGVAAARLDSSLDAAGARDVYAKLRDGSLKLLYVAPERLANERFLATLAKLRIAMLAVDEAHCISEWGHNFRPDYMKLAALAQRLRVGRVLALTATATPSVAQQVAAAFEVDADDVVRTPMHRANLHLAVTTVSAAERPPLLVDRLRSRPRGP
ncbi:MAG TPA: ATP-dependent DNA helicase RecQ, partial [Tepidisphaeraceae bacterium]|nr:ATP-dependent DNA helicase RecQ [Tepidisphaeraceae bacterium]